MPLVNTCVKAPLRKYSDSRQLTFYVCILVLTVTEALLTGAFWKKSALFAKTRRSDNIHVVETANGQSLTPRVESDDMMLKAAGFAKAVSLGLFTSLIAATSAEGSEGCNDEGIVPPPDFKSIIDTSAFCTSIFWLSVFYVTLLGIVAWAQRVNAGSIETTEENPSTNNVVHKVARTFSHLKIYDTFSELANTACLIAIAILLSDLIQQLFVCIFVYCTDASKAQKCPDVKAFGNTGCTFKGDDEDEKPWSVELPAFFFTLALVASTIWVVSRCCSGV